ncbi:cellobiose 2-epimerase [Bacteroidia bacterium]|nr:cellobiose 2-epimerase [Bacteroidia bacterium]
MTTAERLKRLSEELSSELQNGILPYWSTRMVDHEHGGFYGRIDASERLHPDSDRGVIMYARILWAFSNACNLYGDRSYLDIAERAKNYLFDHFLDQVNGGFFWMVDCNGNPVDTKKQIYAQGFVIYALSEYHRACSCPRSRQVAIETFELIEKYAWDADNGGYIEACDREWRPGEDMRLSEKETNHPKSMNTHLHVIEPCTNLYRIWPDGCLASRMRDILEIFKTRIFNPATDHFGLLFSSDWQPSSTDASYGHEIEAAWLLDEAAEALADQSLTDSTEAFTRRVAASAAQGLLADGSMAYEYSPTTGHLDAERHWWVQAEAVVGFFNLWQKTGQERYLDYVINAWEYIKAYLIDTVNGEWHWSRLPDGSLNPGKDKAGFWKCPYHNTRMCTELITRINSMLSRRLASV